MHPDTQSLLARQRMADAQWMGSLWRTRSKQRSSAGPTEGDRPGSSGRSGRPHRTGPGGFGRLWFAAGASNLADGVLLAGLPVLAVRLTSSPALVAGVTVALMVPMVVSTLPGGVIADRFERRRVLVVGNLVRCLGILAVSAAVLAGEPTMAAIYAVAAIAGSTEMVVDTTSQAAVPGLVGDGQLERANARLGGTQVVLNHAIGAPVGGLLAGLGVGLVFGLPAVLFAAAAIVVRRLPRTGGRLADGSRLSMAGAWADVREGGRHLGAHPVLGRVAVANGASNLGNTAFFSIFVLFVIGPLGLPATVYGWFLGSAAAGGVVGSLLARRILTATGPVAALRAAPLLMAGAYLTIVVTSDWRVVAGAVMVVSAASMVWNIGTRVLRQTLVPDALLGRVTASMALIALLAAPVGGVVGGVAAELAGVRVAGFVAVAANLVAWWVLRAVRRPRSDARYDAVLPPAGRSVSGAGDRPSHQLRT